MIDLEQAERIEQQIPTGAFAAREPARETKALAEEVLSSIQGVMNRRQMPSPPAPKVRVNGRGAVQLVWEKPWGGMTVAARAWDTGGSIGFDRFPKGDTVPDPELLSSQPLGHVVEEAVAWLAR